MKNMVRKECGQCGKNFFISVYEENDKGCKYNWLCEECKWEFEKEELLNREDIPDWFDTF